MIVLSDLLQNALSRYRDSIAIITDGICISYLDLDTQSSRLANFLHSNGVTVGSRVGLHLRNCVEYVIADLAILKLGAVKVPLNELMVQSELDYCLDHSGASVIIANSSLPEPGEWSTSLLRVCVVDSDYNRLGWIPWHEALACGPLTNCHRASGEDIALISYTGGTTGQPKGVSHSQHHLAINLFAHVICGDIREDEVMLLTTPLPHSAGYHLQACLLQGGTIVLASKFEASTFVDLVGRYGVTWTFAVPTMLYRLFDQISATQTTLPSLRTILYGAAPMSEKRLQEGLDYFGAIFIQLYGQTECPNFITTLTKEDHNNRNLLGSCGRSVPFLSIRITGQNECQLSSGQIGEVEVASPYLLIEYYRNPSATAVQLNNGWLKTGDLGYVDDAGYLFLVDRAKDMIISGGMNIYSVEVEGALRTHEAVGDVAVIGIPDNDWGEAVVAFIVTNQNVSELEMRHFSKEIMSAYKVPKYFKFIDGLPLTSYGKIDKKALRSLMNC